MTETLRVKYTRRQTNKLPDENFVTTEAGADWEFSVPDGADIDQEYGKAWIVLRGAVDNHFEVNDVQDKASGESFKDRTQRQQRELQQRVFKKPESASPADDNYGAESEYRVFESGSTAADIVEGESVYLENGRVWEIKEDTTRNGKRFGFARIGNRDSIPTGYARVKTYEPSLINKLLGLKEGDHVNIWGKFESWMGRDSVEGDSSTYMWDLNPERIEKISRK